MSEPLLLDPPGVHSGTAAALTTLAASLAHRLAGVLLAHCSAESGGPEAAAFLSNWADSVAMGNHPDPTARPVTLNRLVVEHQLSPIECDLLVLAGLAEEHEGIAATLRTLHPTGEPRPTLGLAALVLGDDPEARQRLRGLVAEGPAFAAGLLTLGAAGSLFERSMLLPDGLWLALHGHDAWPVSPPRRTVGAAPAGLEGWLAERPATRAVRALLTGEPTLLLVSSDDPAVGLARCAALAEAAGQPAVAAAVDLADPAELGLLSLHATVRGAIAVAVAERHTFMAGTAGATPVASDGLTGPLLVCAPAGAVQPPADRAVISLVAGPVSAADQRAAWLDVVPALTPEACEALADRHRLDPAVTAQLGLDLRGEPVPSSAEVSALVRSRLATTLPAGVELTTPDIGWDEIVLPQEGVAQLSEAVARLGHQHLVLDAWDLRRRAHAMHGARLLLTGPPGTGKSLAARVVATAAGTDLLVVDVSRIVSKWLGETEKNLAGAFEAAERTQAVLMLDEADALFGTRTEISDAHDRYANLETAYLLARLDRFEGLAILTTNLRANIDPAFLRRIDYVVEFPLPDLANRIRLWQGHLPTPVLAADVDIDALAGLYPVPGAWIRNVSVAAAFAAAAADGLITQDQLVAAMRREYAKASLPFPEFHQGDDMTRHADCDCDNCRGGDLPAYPFIAPRVTHGMLLGEDDFRVLVGYPRGKHLLHQAWLHGTGVIWGYPVCGTGLWELEVGPGLAVDPMGRDLIHEACERLDLREVRDRAVADGLLEETSSKDADCRTGRVWACVVAEFDGCLSSPVPTLADPCDVTRSHDDYSRVLERARIDIRLGRCPDPDGCPDPRTSGDYHRVRVLLGLDAVGEDDEAGEEAQEARARVLAAAYPARALECELAEMACRDAIDLQPETEPGEQYLGLFPTADEDPAVVLAEVLIKLRDRDGCWEFDGPAQVRECVRSTLLPTDLITALTCGLAPGLLDPAAAESAEGPRVDGAGIELNADGKKMIIPVTAALVSGTVAGSVEVTTLTPDKGDRWVVEDIYDTAYDPDWGDNPGGAIVVRLAYSLAERPAGALVRVRVCGTGGKPVMGADPLAPLAGVVGGPPGTVHEGHDAVWTFRTEPPSGDGAGYETSSEEEVAR